MAVAADIHMRLTSPGERAEQIAESLRERLGAAYVGQPDNHDEFDVRLDDAPDDRDAARAAVAEQLDAIADDWRSHFEFAARRD